MGQPWYGVITQLCGDQLGRRPDGLSPGLLFFYRSWRTTMFEQKSEPLLNRVPSFALSFVVQAMLLLAIAGQRGMPGYGGAHIRHSVAARDVMHIYYEPAPPEAMAAAEPATPPAPQPAPPEKPVLEASAKATAEAAPADSAASDSEDSPGSIAPFANWNPTQRPGSIMMGHHMIQPAMPIFTPDPPLMHGKAPEAARGKEMVVKVVIGADGSIAQATVVEGYDLGVTDAVMETLRRWLFVPAKVNGMPVPAQRELRFRFPG
jgi:TonB family protein